MGYGNEVAVVQIAYKHNVFVFQIGKWKELLMLFRTLLVCNQVFKVGNHVLVDIWVGS
ncbi:hypothetical protein HK096_010235, partial [Nowakowskiella sp. JEL0078]